MQEQSFEDFAHASLPVLSRRAYALTGNRDRGEDLLQDTLVKLARAWRRVRHDSNPVAYAHKVMLNTYLSAWYALRRRGTYQAYEDDVPAPDEYHLADSRDQLRRALQILPRNQRVVLVLGYLEDLPDADIAVLLNRKPATIRSLRHRALQTLRDALSIEVEVVRHV